VSAAVACGRTHGLRVGAATARLPRAEVRGFVTADGTGFRLDGSP
jgi:hypothetical protein